MKVSRQSMGLYVVTDRSWLAGRSLADQVEICLGAGATFLQLREKQLGFDEFVREARLLREIAARHGVPFVVNDRVDVALEAGADGVHVGQDDMAAGNVRVLLGPDKILGVSAHTVEEALLAQQNGADYLGVGAMFSTSTKPDAGGVSFDMLSAICRAVSIPVVAIGGIGPSNLERLAGTGADGAAVISALFGAPEIGAATRELAALSRRTFGGSIQKEGGKAQ